MGTKGKVTDWAGVLTAAEEQKRLYTMDRTGDEGVLQRGSRLQYLMC